MKLNSRERVNKRWNVCQMCIKEHIFLFMFISIDVWIASIGVNLWCPTNTYFNFIFLIYSCKNWVIKRGYELLCAVFLATAVSIMVQLLLYNYSGCSKTYCIDISLTLIHLLLYLYTIIWHETTQCKATQHCIMQCKTIQHSNAYWVPPMCQAACSALGIQWWVRWTVSLPQYSL